MNHVAPGLRNGSEADSDFEEFYAAVIGRDPSYEGRFVYAVRTTGVYCRPGCKSRSPLRANVEFFPAPARAREAGYRACLRCIPDTSRTADERIVRACKYIEASTNAPTLRELGKLVAMSESHFQRAFSAQMGVSPRQYARVVRETRLRAALESNASITHAIYDAGYGSASHAYGNVRSSLGMSISEFRAGGRDATIAFAIVNSRMGLVLVAATARGVCRVDMSEDASDLELRLRQAFPNAAIGRADDGLETTASLIVRYLAGETAWPMLPVDVRASAFQARVWSALRDVAPGTTMSYSELARAIGSPSSARAVARACASNPVALLIPCHRIVPSSGGTGGYRWDPERKKRLLELERSREPAAK